MSDKKAQLERELLDLKKVIREYRKTPSAFRNVTESEFKAAIRRFYEISAEMAELDKPADPYAGMTVDELQSQYDELKKAYQAKGYRDTRTLAKLMTLETKINAMKGSDD